MPLKYRESEDMKLHDTGLWETLSMNLKYDRTLISKREACPFFAVFLSFWRLIFCLVLVFSSYSLIIFQGFVFTHHNDRKFLVCVSFKLGLSLIFRIRRLFSHLLPWQPSPEFLYIVIQCPLSPWPLYHNLVHPGQRTPLMIEGEVPESLAWRISRHNQKKEIK